MKCWNSGFNAQGSRVIIVVVQVGAVKICVAAVEALRKNKKKDETQVFFESHPCMSKLRVLVPAFSLLYWVRDRDYRIGSNFWKFYLIRPVSHEVNRFFWSKCSDCLDRNEVFWCSECVHNVQHLLYWQGQRVRDALLIPPLHATWMFLLHLPFMMRKLLLEKK